LRKAAREDGGSGMFSRGRTATAKNHNRRAEWLNDTQLNVFDTTLDIVVWRAICATILSAGRTD
jgi:hypothetical protein